MSDQGLSPPPPPSPLPPRTSLRKLHFKDEPESNNKKLQMSFGGCGFLGVYHVGVGKCVVDHAPHLFTEFDAFYGASAGAITAVCAACKSDPMIPYRWVKKTFEESQKYWFGMLNPRFDLYGRLRIFLESFLPKNAHMLCRGTVKISLTIVGDNGLPTNWLVSDFKTRRELLNIIIASSFIPGYAGFRNLPIIRGKRCCDGGFTSNIPCVSDPDVITVTPFSGFCDICPRNESYTHHMINLCDQPMLLSPTNMYRLAKSLCPTSWAELEDLYHQGYKDCLSFLRKEGLVPDPIIQKRKTICMPPANAESEQNEATTSCDLPGHGHSRMTSLTLSSTGEFFICDGERERSSVASLPLEDVERGLDLRGTEKATNLIRQYGRRESLNYDTDNKWDQREEKIGVISRIVMHPVGLVRYSWNSLLWMVYICSLREANQKASLTRPRHLNTCEDEEEEVQTYEEGLGLFGSILSSSHSSLLSF